jgi:hypothetical protein
MNHMKNQRGFTGLAALAFAVVSVSAAWAQSPDQPTGAGAGQPARAIRLSYVDGQVKLSQGNQVLAEQATANTPLFEGMQLTTGDSGKAEIQFEDGSVARISPDSSLTLVALHGAGTTAEAVMTLNSGLAYFEFQGGNQAGQMSVQFGGSTATTSGFTVLRVTMDNPPGEAAVFSGNAHIVSNNGALTLDLHGGESVALNGANPDNYTMAESIEPNSWDAWNSDRDQVLTSQAAAQTGAPANMGQNANPAWNDLDANGSWYDVPGQGYVWSPYDAANAGFDPYGYGNWMWTPGYGYIWSSGYPWGYLPFQCGAWNFYGGFGWGWAPGMGGCTPWWGLGFYGGPNFGYIPPGYRPITRPIQPRHPIVGRPIPMVTVRRTASVTNTALPARNNFHPVTIAGNSVQALRPLPNRPGYTAPRVIVGTAHLGTTATSAGGQAARPGYSRPPGWTPTQGTQSFFPANRGSGSAGNSQARSASGHPASSGGASHPSSGGYSGGGGHPSGGGGGGFSGGGSHGGGGGGGGGGHH